jgi:hypothetical protein
MRGNGIGFFGKFLNGIKSGKVVIGLIGEPIVGQGEWLGQSYKTFCGNNL